jgi:hypothetical protein
MSGGPQVSGSHLPFDPFCSSAEHAITVITEIRGERQTFENERRKVSARDKRRV